MNVHCSHMEWGPNLSKWGPNGDLILSEMGTKWGPLAAEMGTKWGLNGDLNSVYSINRPKTCKFIEMKRYVLEKIFTESVII